VTRLAGHRRRATNRATSTASWARRTTRCPLPAHHSRRWTATSSRDGTLSARRSGSDPPPERCSSLFGPSPPAWWRPPTAPPTPPPVPRPPGATRGRSGRAAPRPRPLRRAGAGGRQRCRSPSPVDTRHRDPGGSRWPPARTHTRCWASARRHRGAGQEAYSARPALPSRRHHDEALHDLRDKLRPSSAVSEATRCCATRASGLPRAAARLPARPVPACCGGGQGGPEALPGRRKTRYRRAARSVTEERYWEPSFWRRRWLRGSQQEGRALPRRHPRTPNWVKGRGAAAGDP
jgi:hypothetical protein